MLGFLSIFRYILSNRIQCRNCCVQERTYPVLGHRWAVIHSSILALLLPQHQRYNLRSWFERPRSCWWCKVWAEPVVERRGAERGHTLGVRKQDGSSERNVLDGGLTSPRFGWNKKPTMGHFPIFGSAGSWYQRGTGLAGNSISEHMIPIRI